VHQFNAGIRQERVCVDMISKVTSSTTDSRCETCGVTVRNRKGRTKPPRYCSHSCRYPYGVLTATCIKCGKEFRVGCRGRVATAKWCSLACSGGVRRAERRTLECANCGKSFEGKADHGVWPKYCSRVCWAAVRGTKVVSECNWCGSEFEAYLTKGSARPFCSPKCANDSRIKKCVFKCEQCGSGFERRLRFVNNPPRFCSNSCKYQWTVGEHSPSYRGGTWQNESGVHVWCDDAQKYRLEHRVIVESVIGRALVWSDEPIWHINGDMGDNRLENLFLFESYSDMQISIQNSNAPQVSNLIFS